jgi:hypothetical protein
MTESNNDKRFKWALVIYTVLVAGLCLLGSALFVTCNNKTKVVEKITHTRDTVVVRKTDKVVVDSIVWLPGRIDTVFAFNNTDTVYLSGYAKDTIYIEDFQIQVITHDTIIHDTVLIERTVDKQIKHYGIGITAGMSAIYGLTTKKFDVGPGVMVGFTYKF